MDDLVAWLRAQLDEDERVARLAGSGEWTRDGGSIYQGHPTEQVVDWVYGDAWEHIARHDPARVLREVESKRRILDLVAKTREWTNSAAGATAGYAAVVVGDTVRLLALPYADREGFRDEWRP